jgi:hypothetical protein
MADDADAIPRHPKPNGFTKIYPLVMTNIAIENGHL